MPFSLTAPQNFFNRTISYSKVLYEAKEIRQLNNFRALDSQFNTLLNFTKGQGNRWTLGSTGNAVDHVCCVRE